MEQLENDIFKTIHIKRQLGAHQPPHIERMPAYDFKCRGVSHAPLIRFAT